MKLTQKLSAFIAICAMLLIATHNAHAQKKPKLKGLAKELLGTWKFETMEVMLLTTEDKLTEEQKQQYDMAKAMMPMIAQSMKGKMTYTFNADGTYKSINEGEDGSPTETTGKWKLDKNMLTTTPDTPSPDSSAENAEVSIKDKMLNLTMKKEGEAMGAVLKFVK